MDNILDSEKFAAEKKHLFIIFIIYIFFSSIFASAYRYAINPDGIALIRLAEYVARGDFGHSITPTWSPLTAWLMSPLLYLGFDGLTSARIIIAISGAGLLVGSWFLALRFSLSQNARFIACLILALLISCWTIQNIGADILITALLVWYLYIITTPGLLKNKKLAFSCGIVGGIAFLAKYYTLPFFILHFLAMVILKGFFDRNEKGFNRKAILISLTLGMIGFFIISGTWITMMSVKYGRFTMSLKGKLAHSVMGPEDMERRHPHFYGGLHRPSNPEAIHIFEDLVEIQDEFKTWSPFESKEYFIHQIKLIKLNIIYMFNHFIRQSPFFTYPFVVATIVLIPIGFLVAPINSEKRFLYTWSVVTFVIYSSGYLLIIARSPRRFYTLMIIVLFLSLHFLEGLRDGIKKMIATDYKRKILTLYLFMIIIPAFTLKPGIQFLKSVKNIATIDYVNPYKKIAEQIKSVDFPSPYAIIRSSQKPHTDLYIAYYLKKQFLGRPLSRDIKGITEELKSAGARSIVVFDNLDIVEKLKNDDRYVHLASIKLNKDERYQYAVNIKQDEITNWDSEVNIFCVSKWEQNPLLINPEDEKSIN
jgi:hypothetical protein